MKISNKESLSYILDSLKGKKRYISIMTLIEITSSLISIFCALILKYVIDSATSSDEKGFYLYIGILISVVFIQIILRALERFLSEYTRSHLENSLKERLFKDILEKEYRDVSKTHSGEWLNRLTNDTKVVSDGAVDIIPTLFGTITRLIGCLIMIIVLSRELAILIIPSGILIFILSFILRKKLKSLHKDVQEKDGLLRIFMSESLENLFVIHSYSKEDDMSKELRERSESHRKARISKSNYSNIAVTGFFLVMRGIYLLSIVILGKGLLGLSLSYGKFTGILELVSSVQNPFVSLSGFLPKYYSMISSTERLMETSMLESGERKIIPDESDTYDKLESINAKHISFRYLDKTVIDDLSFEIKRGSFTAITGESGSGKTTLFKLILGFYGIDRGSLGISFKDGEKPLDASCRGLFAYVPQANLSMSGRISEIVSFNDENIDKERLNEALHISESYSFVSSLKDKENTFIGERGIGISEGEMERLLIARAIYSRRPILLLDEITASLDKDTEDKVLRNIKSMTDKTVIIITHRPKAIEYCDNIINLDRI